jgi:hypothetical protein
LTNDQLRNRARNYIEPLLELHSRNRLPAEPLISVLLTTGTNLAAERLGIRRTAEMLRSAANELELESIV